MRRLRACRRVLRALGATGGFYLAPSAWRAQYRSLGAQMRATKHDNFQLALAMLRARAPDAIYDDRFSAAFERKNGDPAVFTVAYVVRAVSLGKYVRPQASVEDMYRPDRYGRSATGNVEVTAAK